MIHPDNQMNHCLPEEALPAAQSLPDLFPVVVCGKVVTDTEMFKATAETSQFVVIEVHRHVLLY
jgi:hypothetical protein